MQNGGGSTIYVEWKRGGGSKFYASKKKSIKGAMHHIQMYFHVQI